MVLLRPVIVALLLLVLSAAAPAEQPTVPVVYPKNNSVVGSKVNVVLDPATDWSTVPFFQVIAGKTSYPPVDTSTGKHAFQGAGLDPGINTITVKVLAPSDDKKQKGFKEVLSRGITVFCEVELYTGFKPPAGFSQDLFHSREHEAECSGCHALEAPPQDSPPRKPEDMICYACHKGIPTGKKIHGPAAVWDCLSCHNPDLYPVKYQFTSADPWKVSKTTQTVAPMVFTIPTAELFKPVSTAFVSQDKTKEMLKLALDYIKQNRGDKIRLEVHSDNTPLKVKKEKGKKAPAFKDNQTLTNARAKALASLLKASGVSGKKLTAVGMGDTLPRAPNNTKDGRELNNRVEFVVYPADVKVTNSMKLPVLTDRERVVVSLTYVQGPMIKKLRIIEKIPKGIQYIKGSGILKGRVKEPRIKDDALIWDLGDMGSNFAETLFYVVKKSKKAPPVPEAFTAAYTSYADRDVTREFDPKLPARRGFTVAETCKKCHTGMLEGKFKHGPVDAGYCNLCHDPHASPNSAWLRKPSWELCTTCHAEKARERHVVVGIASGDTHPTHNKRDPVRPGKELICTSCHDPHSSDNRNLYALDARTRSELCIICHRRR